MKRTLLKISGIITMISLLLCFVVVPQPLSAQAADTAKYTFMVYLNGSDLESDGGAAASDLAEMMQVGSNDDIKVVVETGGTREWTQYNISNTTNQRYLVNQGNLQLVQNNVGKKSMGDSATLKDFIVWAVTNYPAEKYVLDCWNHGAGFTGYAYDELFEDDSTLSLNDIQNALADAEEVTGIKFELIGFDACLMANLETAQVLTPYADWFVASEETEPGHGWNYTPILQALADTPSISGDALGRVIADGFRQQGEVEGTADTTTLSVIELSKVPAVVTALEVFVTAAGADIDDQQSFDKLAGGRSKSEDYGVEGDGGTDMVDIGDLCDHVPSTYENEAAALRSAVIDSINYQLSAPASKPQVSGLSIFFPCRNKGENLSYYLEQYAQIPFSQTYRNFVSNYGEKYSGTTGGVEFEQDTPQQDYADGESENDSSWMDNENLMEEDDAWDSADNWDEDGNWIGEDEELPNYDPDWDDDSNWDDDWNWIGDEQDYPDWLDVDDEDYNPAWDDDSNWDEDGYWIGDEEDAPYWLEDEYYDNYYYEDEQSSIRNKKWTAATATSGVWQPWSQTLEVSNDLNKQWTVKFSSLARRSTIIPENIYVLKEDGTRHPVTPVLQDSKDEVKIVPQEPYSNGQTYVLCISSGIKSDSGKPMTKGYKMPFLINTEANERFTVKIRPPEYAQNSSGQLTLAEAASMTQAEIMEEYNVSAVYAVLGRYLTEPGEDIQEIQVLGSDNNVTLTASGKIQGNFDGNWVMLNGNFVMMDLFNINEEGPDLYGIAAKLNGEEVDILVLYEAGEASGTVLGAWKGIDDETNMSDKNIIIINPGDLITPVFDIETWDQSGEMPEEGFESEYISRDGDSFTIPAGGPVLEQGRVEAGQYDYGFLVVDTAQNYSWSEYTEITVD